jgi:5-formyltetrahydrofolate cyclo-ligase
MDRAQLRIALRKKRRAVPPAQSRAIAKKIARRLLRIVAKGQHIAVYSAIDGEIDLGQFVVHAQRRGCTIYVPHIVNRRAGQMEFHQVLPIAHTNRLRLKRLDGTRNKDRRINPRLLDIVLLPLVAFDTRGWRLGFGAGFYDRKFHFVRRHRRRKPRMIGIGYEFQRVPTQTPGSWDVPLDAVMTETGLHRMHHPLP